MLKKHMLFVIWIRNAPLLHEYTGFKMVLAFYSVPHFKEYMCMRVKQPHVCLLSHIHLFCTCYQWGCDLTDRFLIWVFALLPAYLWRIICHCRLNKSLSNGFSTLYFCWCFVKMCEAKTMKPSVSVSVCIDLCDAWRLVSTASGLSVWMTTVHAPVIVLWICSTLLAWENPQSYLGSFVFVCSGNSALMLDQAGSVTGSFMYVRVCMFVCRAMHPY